tara:strand:- start:5406 stop:5591 length:186 start_codon:yes stop_codon:yes gene_type:complete
LKFKIPQELMLLVQAHAEQRGITVEEYLEEFIGLLNEHKAKGNMELDSESIQNALQTYSKL